MIYLDYAAATPLSPKAKAAMEPYFSEYFFNPSAAYLPANSVRADYEAAKSAIARAIGAKGSDLVITSGATEANNLAFSLVQKSCLYLATEHDSVANVAKAHHGVPIKVDQTGMINLADLKAKLTDDVELVSIALANNEIGTITPLAEIAEIIRSVRETRLKNNNQTPLYLHSDASQALNLIDINVARLGVDLLTLNAAKVYGPKGVGALFVARNVNLSPMFLGGGQELGLRSGTENVPGVIGFAAALTEAKSNLAHNRKKYAELAHLLETELLNHSIIPRFIGNVKHKLVNFVNLTYPGLDAERLIYRLEQNEVYLSTGAACAASKGEKSHTLKALGLSTAEIAGSLRITLGVGNTAEDIKTAARLIKQAVSEESARHGI